METNHNEPEREQLSKVATDPEEAWKERIRYNLTLTPEQRYQQYLANYEVYLELRNCLKIN